MAIARQTAYKVWLSQIEGKEYIKQEGFNPNYIEIDGNQVSRISILASVVSKFMSDDGNYGALTLDDGSDTIRVKAFGPDVIKIKGTRIGTLIRFVGKLKIYNDEIYLSPEVAKAIEDPNWLLVHQLELGKPTIAKIEEAKPTESSLKETPQEDTTEQSSTEPKGKVESPPAKEEVVESGEMEVRVEKVEAPNPAEAEDNLNLKVVELIKKHDSGNGADMKKVFKDLDVDEDEAKNLVVGLLKSGDIFEPKKGMLKVLE